MRSSSPTPDSGHPTLKAFQDLLVDGHPEEAEVTRILSRLASEGLTEMAQSALKRQRPSSKSPADPFWHRIRIGLERDTQRAREKRIQGWQLDPQRRTLRLCLEVRKPSSDLNPSALLHILNQALLAAGMPLAMGLEKNPRPMTTLGPPLPL